MKDGLVLKVGDRVVRYGRVLKVFQIKNEMVYFQPNFTSPSNNSLTYQVSAKNVHASNIRKVVSKKELQQLFKSILSQPAELGSINSMEVRLSLTNNDLTETLKALKNLWLERIGKTASLASGKLSIYQQALEQATEEVAAVKNVALDKAKQAIMSALKAGGKAESAE